MDFQIQSAGGAPLHGDLPSWGGVVRRIAIDLDGTSSDTAACWAEKLFTKFPVPNTTPEQLLAKHRLASLVPDWQLPEPAAYVAQLRVCPDTHREYRPIPGAVEGARFFAERIEIEYLTMRPRCVLDATAWWLDHHGFPQAEIVACPDAIDFRDRAAWKAQQLHDRYPSLIGIVEDETKVVHALPKGYRGAVLLFSHDQTPRDDIQVIPCATWDHVIHHGTRVLNIERRIEFPL